MTSRSMPTYPVQLTIQLPGSIALVDPLRNTISVVPLRSTASTR